MQSAKRKKIKKAMEDAVEYLSVEQSYTSEQQVFDSIGEVLEPLKEALKDIKIKSEK